MDEHLDPVNEAVLALLLLCVEDEDTARRLLGMWARVGRLTDEQREQVIRAVLEASPDWPRHTVM